MAAHPLILFFLLSVHLQLAQTRQAVFGKRFLYEQLIAYRMRLAARAGMGLSTTAPREEVGANLSNLPPYPGAELIKPPLQLKTDVERIDLPQIAYELFKTKCAGSEGEFGWGVAQGGVSPQVIENGWTASAIPNGYLVPVCNCSGGRAATYRKLIGLASEKLFEPLLDTGFSYLSNIVMETCDESSNEVYWQPKCYDECFNSRTKSCILESKNNDTAEVICNCYHGYNTDSRCRSVVDGCSARVTAQSSQTGYSLCQVKLGNKCTQDADRYLCTCYAPTFENKTQSSHPNCLGMRAHEDYAKQCNTKFCGSGYCNASGAAASSNASSSTECHCQVGYAGADCMSIEPVIEKWGEWSTCQPACGNTGSQVRVRECSTADRDSRFCHGLRREHRRCLPNRCFEGHALPVFVKNLSDPVPNNLVVWAVITFFSFFCIVFFSGMFVSLSGSFQDWKLEALNQSGKLAHAIDDVCDELIRGNEYHLFFESNMFVPEAIVDHVTGVKKLRGIDNKKKKNKNKENDRRDREKEKEEKEENEEEKGKKKKKKEEEKEKKKKKKEKKKTEKK